MLLAKLDIKNKLVLIFRERMNKKNIKKNNKNEVKQKNKCKKNCFFTSLVVTPTTTMMQAQLACDSLLAVCSHNQSDEDLAMSIKYSGVPFRLALPNC